MLQDVVESCWRHTGRSECATGNLQLAKRIDEQVARIHREFLRNVVQKTHTPPTTIAKKIGVAPSTLTRILKQGDDAVTTMHAGTIAKLESFSGLTAPALDAEPRAAAAEFREDAVRYQAAADDDTLTATLRAIIGGRKNIDPWVIRSRSLECSGFMPGDVVLVDLSTMPRAGEPACAQVYNWRDGTAETVMRLLEPPYLVAATFDPALRKPLLVDDDRVIVKGVILPHRLRPRPN